MRRLPGLATCVALLVAGCLDETTTTIPWEVRNEGTEPIAYTIILEDDRRAQETHGEAGAGEVKRHEMTAVGTHLTATAQLRDQARTSSGVPFAVDGFCTDHQVVATWDGARWDVDAAADCA